MFLLLPVLLPLAGGALLLHQTDPKRRDRLALAVTVATALLSLWVCLRPEVSVDLLRIQGDLRLALRSDSLAKFFLALVSCIWTPVLFFSFPYLRHAGRESCFLGFYVMSLGTLTALALAANFVTLYLAFELMSLITLPLVLHSTTAAARRAGFKYLGFSVFGAGVALAGYFFLAYYLKTPDFRPGGVLDLTRAAEHRELLLVVGFLMILGFGAKAGMLPMHSWLPSAHPVAPAPASAVLSGLITKGGVIAIIRVIYYLYGPDFLRGSWTQYTLLTLALVTVFTGSMLAYREKLFKRRLAWSTVSQLSYILFGLFLLTREGTAAALLQMIVHALAKNALFLGAGAVIYATNHTRVDQLRGIGRQMPVTMSCFALASLSIIGIPPMGGFVSKWFLLDAGLHAPCGGFGLAGLAVLILSALLTAGYLLPIVTTGFFPGDDYISEHREVHREMLWPQMFFALLCLWIGLFPGGVLRWLGVLVESII